MAMLSNQPLIDMGDHSSSNEQVLYSPRDPLVALFTPPMSRSTSRSSVSSSTTGSRRLSGRKKKQLAQLFDKGVDDAGCAAILKVNTELVNDYRNKAPEGDMPSPDKSLASREREQLREMFARQISDITASEILQLDIDAVTEFKEEEAARQAEEARRRRLAQAAELPMLPTSLAIFILRATATAKMQALAFAAFAPELAKDPVFRVTVGSAAVGGVAGAATGGGAGTIVGGVVGTVAGMGPALFTFGLSIPIGTGLGGSIGLVLGVVTGGTVGATAGGASGYVGYKYRKEFKEKGSKLLQNARQTADAWGVSDKVQQLGRSNTFIVLKAKTWQAAEAVGFSEKLQQFSSKVTDEATAAIAG